MSDIHGVQKQLEDVAVKREEALHTRTHYTAELTKEKAKRDKHQAVADTVQLEFEVAKSWQ